MLNPLSYCRYTSTGAPVRFLLVLRHVWATTKAHASAAAHNSQKLCVMTRVLDRVRPPLRGDHAYQRHNLLHSLLSHCEQSSRLDLATRL